MKNRLEKLIDKFKYLIGQREMSIESSQILEKTLNVKLSCVFKFLNAECCYGYFSQEIYSPFGEDDYSVAAITKNMRQFHQLPHKSLVLGQDAVTMTIMKTSEDASNEEVYIIALEDVERYCNGEKLKYDYEYFPTFIYFF